MTDYLGQSKWALTRRRWPLIRLVCVVFFLGVCFGVALSFALSASGLTVDTKTAARLDPGVSRSGPDAVRASGFSTPSAPTREHAGDARAALARTTSLNDVRNGGSMTRMDQTPVGAVSGYGSTWETSDGASARAHPEARSLEDTSSVIEPIAQSIEQLITEAALEFGVDPQVMLRRAFCESSYNPNAVGRAQEVSIFQFMPSTWVIYAPKVGYSLREIGHVEAQARVAAYMESIGEGRQWTCR